MAVFGSVMAQSDQQSTSDFQLTQKESVLHALQYQFQFETML